MLPRKESSDGKAFVDGLERNQKTADYSKTFVDTPLAMIKEEQEDAFEQAKVT